MSDSSKTTTPVPIGPRIVASGGFELLYREGMSLIEDVAAYLDGAGRDRKPRPAARSLVRLRHRIHAAHDPPDAARLLAAAAARRQRRRAHRRERPDRKGKGQVLRDAERARRARLRRAARRRCATSSTRATGCSSGSSSSTSSSAARWPRLPLGSAEASDHRPAVRGCRAAFGAESSSRPRPQQKARREAGLFTNSNATGLTCREPLKRSLKRRDAAAAVEQLARAAGPGRVGLGVDVELQRVARFAVGRAGLVLGAVRHHHGDHVVVGVDVFLHRRCLEIKRAPRRPESQIRNVGGFIQKLMAGSARPRQSAPCQLRRMGAAPISGAL